MILDWYSHCGKVHRTKKLELRDPSDKKSAFRQEIYYLRYLINVRKMNKLNCYYEWSNIKNGRANAVKDDPDQMNIEFFALYKMAQFTKNIPGPLNSINIYQSEIDYLNNLKDVPIWIKQFWLILLAYYKFASQIYKKVEFSPTVAAWCMRQVKGLKKTNREFHSHRDQIGKFNTKYEVIKFSHILNHDYNIFVPSFIAPDTEDDEGSVIRLRNLSRVSQLCDFITSNHSVCEQCGRVFPTTSKTKRKICKKCYKKSLKMRNLACKAIQKKSKNLGNFPEN